MEELIAPILKYKCDIYYKFYTMYEEDVMPFGPKHNKNFKDKFWKKTAERFGFNIEENGYSLGSTNKPMVHGNGESFLVKFSLNFLIFIYLHFFLLLLTSQHH